MDNNRLLEELRNQLNVLVSQREMLEIEADAIHSELTSPSQTGGPPVGIKGGLVDEEGFPRGDIDIYNVKFKRKRLAEINTDYKALMKRIESILTEIYNLNQSQPIENPCGLAQSAGKESNSILTSTPQNTKLLPIAIIDEVFEGSPAETAGLQNGDEVLDFGGVNCTFADSEGRGYLPAIGKVVSQSIGRPISVTVLRDKRASIELELKPQTWSGRGLLGCHLSPKL